MRKILVTGLLAASLLTACAAPAADNSAELQNQVSALQTQVAALESEHTAASPFDVAVAQYVLDTAGFHGMAEALAETQTIEASYGSTVTRVKTVLANTVWPEELHEQEAAFVALLDELAAKIEADDGAGAVEIADQVHDAQHDLSHAIGEWLGTAAEHSHGN
jgi:hypothetical protein